MTKAHKAFLNPKHRALSINTAKSAAFILLGAFAALYSFIYDLCYKYTDLLHKSTLYGNIKLTKCSSRLFINKPF